MGDSLGEALPKEQARVRALILDYKAIGPAGSFAAAMMEASLKAADTAVMSGDPIEMIRAYEDLKGYTG